MNFGAAIAISEHKSAGIMQQLGTAGGLLISVTC